MKGIGKLTTITKKEARSLELDVFNLCAAHEIVAINSLGSILAMNDRLRHHLNLKNRARLRPGKASPPMQDKRWMVKWMQAL